MTRKNKGFLFYFLLLILLAIASWWRWDNMKNPEQFDCWGRLHIRNSLVSCVRETNADIFLSMRKKEQGYLLISGSWACKDLPLNPLNGLVHFSYEKDGSYYSLHMKERNAQLEEIFGMLKYPQIKLKVTQLNSGDNILSLRNEILMLCTND
ncbi:hypothetical protein [Erwinia persicina]|uniref:hypothetical protein n=1 Tax=Erwinia persicina TaxID=55211 RepID=UPI0017826619|nr:hypothetical protein [Erwinia persicina]MBD8162643.1 hypothetical protein [Erwinia persicina]MBD8214713.1 hypothetical protein [Erwinia persicina]